ncbi:MAG: DUF2628 domain-containing protein [Rhodospirillales bacterium]|nr:DUF2628 domain-containing protein [Rhodospirillales bacterium]
MFAKAGPVFGRTSAKPNTSQTMAATAATDTIGEISGGTLSEEERLCAFIGPNADRYLNLKFSPQKWGFKKICWTAFLFPMAWLFYRKLYIEGIAILLIPIAIVILFPQLSNANFAISGVIAMMGTTYYLGRAEMKIKAISAVGLSAQEEEVLLRKAGGVSRVGAGFAMLIYAVAIAAALMPLLAGAQP